MLWEVHVPKPALISWAQRELIVWFTLSTSTQMTLPLFQICTIKLHVNILLTGLECWTLDWRGGSGSKTFCLISGRDDTIELQRLRHCPLNSWPYISSLRGIIKWTTVHGKPRTRLQGRCRVSLYFHFTERWHVLRSICIVVTLEVPLSTDTNGKELGPNKLTDYVGTLNRHTTSFNCKWFCNKGKQGIYVFQG